MSGPFIYVGTWLLKTGKAAEARKGLSEHVRLVEADEPRVISFNFYLDDAGERVTVVQVHPDAESMEFHLRLVEEHLAKASDFLDRPESVQYFGRTSERLIEAMAPYEPGSVATFPEHVAGFVRSADAEGAGR